MKTLNADDALFLRLADRKFFSRLRQAERLANPPLVDLGDGTFTSLSQWHALAPFRALPENIDDMIGMDFP